MATLWHLTDPDTWADAVSRGTFTESTRGASIAHVGFLHASYADQLARVTSFVYHDVTGRMVALGIDPALLPQHGLELRDEPGSPGDPTLFPHVYGGDLPLAVITEVIQVTVTDGVLAGWGPGSVARAVALGARLADLQPDPRWTVLLDPAGHPFCITTVGPPAPPAPT